ncbi:MAG TPA: FAD:protein FMN transferase [Candidatus Dormibacteraeota bacterium]
MTSPDSAAAEGRALGCATRLVVTDPRGLEAARTAMEEVLGRIDAACSRFREDSEITALNAAAGRVTRVSPLLADALEVALRAARLTGGAVDPTIGSALRISGYDRDYEALPPVGEAINLVARPVAGWRSVRLDRLAGSVWLPGGVELDLGATAKAYAADLAAVAAAQAAGCGVLVSLGGDIAVSGPPPDGGWRIQVGEDSSAPIADHEETIAIQQGGLATSSTTVRRWRRGSTELHHLIDPQTGLPVSGPWRSATVAAAGCVDANTASTAAIVLGDAAADWLDARALPARLVAQDGSVLRVAGWPAA